MEGTHAFMAWTGKDLIYIKNKYLESQERQRNNDENNWTKIYA